MSPANGQVEVGFSNRLIETRPTASRSVWCCYRGGFETLLLTPIWNTRWLAFPTLALQTKSVKLTSRSPIGSLTPWLLTPIWKTTPWPAITTLALKRKSVTFATRNPTGCLTGENLSGSVKSKDHLSYMVVRMEARLSRMEAELNRMEASLNRMEARVKFL